MSVAVVTQVQALMTSTKHSVAFYPSTSDDFYDMPQTQQQPMDMNLDGDAGFSDGHIWNDTGISDGQNDLFWMWNAGHF